jgi:hypothetical protein
MTTARAGGVSSRWRAPRQPRLLPGRKALPASHAVELQQHGQGVRRQQGVGAARLVCQRLAAQNQIDSGVRLRSMTVPAVSALSR